MRVARCVVWIEADEVEHFAHALLAGGMFTKLVGEEALFDLVADREARIQRAERILEDDLHALAQRSALGGGELLDLAAIKGDGACRGWLEAEGHAAERGLAGARLADEAECLSASHREVDAVDGANCKRLTNQWNATAHLEVALYANELQEFALICRLATHRAAPFLVVGALRFPAAVPSSTSLVRMQRTRRPSLSGSSGGTAVVQASIA